MKSQFHDIIPPEKRSIRNIPIPNQSQDKGSQSANPSSSISNQSHFTPTHEETLYYKGSAKTDDASKFFLWMITFAIAGGLFVFASSFFAKAHITVTTKKFDVEIPKNIIFSLKPSSGEVGYSSVLLSDSVQAILPSVGEKEVSEYAQGTLVVYNNYDTNSQKLIKGTRFENSKGLIYKTTKDVTVPGKKKVGGKDVPGSVEVVVTAEKPGTEYNSSLTDFTIPGFKGSPRFQGFYARSKTEMTGGNVGKIALLDEKLKEAKVAELKQTLHDKLVQKISKEIPNNQIFFENLATFDYKVGTPQITNDKATLEMVGNIKIYVFDKGTLAKKLLEKQDISIAKGDEFVFETKDITSSLKGASSSLPFDIQGKTQIQFLFDVESFKNSLLGKDTRLLPNIASSYSAISDLKASITPFWITKIPTDADKVEIDIK